MIGFCQFVPQSPEKTKRKTDLKAEESAGDLQNLAQPGDFSEKEW